MSAVPFAGFVDRLQPRERLLLGVMGLVLVGLVVFLGLFMLSTSLDDVREENEANAQILREIARNRGAFRDRERASRDIERRYTVQAPALQSFLEEKATEQGIEIRDAQDRPEVKHGTQFTERSVQIRLNKVELRPFVKLMEEITGGRYPLAITKLRVRKRIAEPNSFDVEMTVSAFDRVGPTPRGTGVAGAAALRKSGGARTSPSTARGTP